VFDIWVDAAADGPGQDALPGSKNQRTVEIARAAVEAGITPLEVMLKAMRERWDQGTPESKREAATIAKDAAPYVHPRLASIDQNINEIQPYAYVVEPCRTAEEWEAEVRADGYLTDAESSR
jgi:hypothetical protein